MNPELITAVKERLVLGHTEEMIRGELKQAGYDDAVIEQVIKEAHEVSSITAIAPSGVIFPEVSELLSTGWSFAMRYSMVAFLLAIPLMVLEVLVYLSSSTEGLNNASGPLVMGVGSIVVVAVYLFLVTAALRITAIDDGTRAVPLSEVWGWTKANFLGLAWVFLLSGLVVWGGFMLFFIPGIIVSLLIYFSQYVYVQEGARGMSALLRSRELVSGYWWVLAGRLLLIGLVFVLVLIGFGIVVGIVTTFTGVDISENTTAELVMNLGGQVLSAFATMIGLKIGMELYRTLAHSRPAVGVVREARGKYMVLAWIGLIVPTLLIASLAFWATSSPVLHDSIEEKMMEQDAKLRALELRNDLESNPAEESVENDII